MVSNIYYINTAKVYEIKMMLNNSLAKTREIENEKSRDAEVTGTIDASLGFMKIFNGAAKINARGKGSNSQKVMESFEIKYTKSVILNEVAEKCHLLDSFSDVQEGTLIMINNVRLSLINEPEMRTDKLFTGGAFKNMNVPGAHGFDFSSLLNSMFKDYAYKIQGLTTNSEAVLFKIPMTFETEFESSYSIDDLFIGNVSLIGIYKGPVRLEDLSNTFEFLVELGNTQNNIPNWQREDAEIQESQYPVGNNYQLLHAENGNEDYHYIDILAVVQQLNIVQ